jgi:hypothetical protein
MPVIPAIVRIRQKDLKFEASLGNTASKMQAGLD